MKQRIICFSGQRFNGKDESSDYLADQLNGLAVGDGDGCGENSNAKCQYKFRRIAFGDAVKLTYINAFDVDIEFVEKWKPIDDPPHGFNRNIREALMFIGDGFRQIKPTVWVDYLFKLLDKDDAIISDGRYYSEIHSVTERGGFNIAIWRPGFENNINHPSESQLKPEIDKLIKEMGSTGKVQIDSPFDYFLVNQGNVEDLRETIDDELIPFLSQNYLV